MHSDKDNPVTTQDALEGSKESTLEWLMELDRDEPEENLFKVEGKVTELSLSAFETEVAARPMTRGRAGADDLDAYISEEIVLSEEGNSSANGFGANQDDEADFDGLMAIDFSRQDDSESDLQNAAVDDGSDILGLADEDDIGESFLVVKRVPKQAQAEPAGSVPLLNGAEADAPAESGTDVQDAHGEQPVAEETVADTVADIAAMAGDLDTPVIDAVSDSDFQLPAEESRIHWAILRGCRDNYHCG